MTRTQLLQEIRRMRFVEAYVGWQARRLTQGEAARVRVHRYPDGHLAVWTALVL